MRWACFAFPSALTSGRRLHINYGCRPEERRFEAMPALKAKIESAATALCPAKASPEVFADALTRVVEQKTAAFGVAAE